MRLHSISAICLFTLVCLILLLRPHIRDLGEVGRTYATFWEAAPAHVFRYGRGGSDGWVMADKVPAMIHQVFLTDGEDTGVPAKYSAAIDSCQALHPNWTYNIWSTSAATDFMREHAPHIYPHYAGYKQNIQRANVLRYALLEHFGGVYLDLDITCRQPLDNLRHLPFVTPGAHPAGVNNAFILTRPHHPFLRHLLDGVESRDLTWGMPYIENMLSTGCMFFSNMWMSYVRSLLKDTKAEDRVYILSDEHGDIPSHMLRGAVTTTLFTHGGASSWHGWDAAAIVMIGKHYVMAGLIVVVAIIGIAIGLWRLVSARTARSRNRVGHDRRSIDKTEAECV